MKFAKNYNNKIKKFNKRLYFFDYKNNKKHLKNIDINTNYYKNSIVLNNEECGICLDNIEVLSNVITLGCCNKFIHPCCFVDCVVGSCNKDNSCPFCRKEFKDILIATNRYDSNILKIIALLNISFPLIEKELNNNLLNNNLFEFKNKRKEYCKLNTIAIIKYIKKVVKKIGNIFTDDYMINLLKYNFIKIGVKELTKDKNFINTFNNFKNKYSLSI